MSKFLALILFLISAASFGWGMHKYASSGDEIVSKPLTGMAGEELLPSLTMDMSPVRVFLQVSSEINIQDGTNEAYRYEIGILDPIGRHVAGDKRTQTEKKEDQGAGFDKNKDNHVIDTFSVEESGQYRMMWQVIPKRGEVTSIAYSLRRNVEGINIPLMVFAGACFILGWIVLFFGRRNT